MSSVSAFVLQIRTGSRHNFCVLCVFSAPFAVKERRETEDGRPKWEEKSEKAKGKSEKGKVGRKLAVSSWQNLCALCEIFAFFAIKESRKTEVGSGKL